MAARRTAGGLTVRTMFIAIMTVMTVASAVPSGASEGAGSDSVQVPTVAAARPAAARQAPAVAAAAAEQSPTGFTETMPRTKLTKLPGDRANDVLLDEAGSRLYVTEGSQVHVLSLKGRVLRTLTLGETGTSIRLSPDGTRLWVATEAAAIAYATSDGAELDRVPAPGVDCITDAAPVGDVLVITHEVDCFDGTKVSVIDLDGDRTPQTSLATYGGDLRIATAPDTTRIVLHGYSFTEGTFPLKALDIGSGTPVHLAASSVDTSINDVLIRPGGSHVTVLLQSPMARGADAVRFDLPSLSELGPIDGTLGDLQAGAWAASGTEMITAGESTRSGRVRQIVGASDRSVDWTVDVGGEVVRGGAAVTADGSTAFLLLEGGSSVNRLATVRYLGIHESTVYVDLSHTWETDGFGQATDGKLELYDADTLEYLGTATSRGGVGVLAGVWPGEYRAAVYNGDDNGYIGLFPEVYDDLPFAHLERGAVVTVDNSTLGVTLSVELDPFFTDMFDTPFTDDIFWLRTNGITSGCNPSSGNTLYCPTSTVTRGQMAAFMVRALGLRDIDPRWDFTDTRGHTFERDIKRLATAGITTGCNSAKTRFCPDDPVSRGQMAAFMVRAFGMTDVGDSSFEDDDTSRFETDIERLAHARVTAGCNGNPETFCPDNPVTRGQMAAFLRRAFDWLAREAA